MSTSVVSVVSYTIVIGYHSKSSLDLIGCYNLCEQHMFVPKQSASVVR